MSRAASRLRQMFQKFLRCHDGSIASSLTNVLRKQFCNSLWHLDSWINSFHDHSPGLTVPQGRQPKAPKHTELQGAGRVPRLVNPWVAATGKVSVNRRPAPAWLSISSWARTGGFPSAHAVREFPRGRLGNPREKTKYRQNIFWLFTLV